MAARILMESDVQERKISFRAGFLRGMAAPMFFWALAPTIGNASEAPTADRAWRAVGAQMWTSVRTERRRQNG